MVAMNGAVSQFQGLPLDTVITGPEVTRLTVISILLVYKTDKYPAVAKLLQMFIMNSENFFSSSNLSWL